MNRVRTLVVVLAGGAGGRLELLTHERAKPAAVVEAGAVVRDSVVLPGAVVRKGATVERAILDDLVHVARGVRVGSPAETCARRAPRDRRADLPPGRGSRTSTERLQGSRQLRLGRGEVICGAPRRVAVSARWRAAGDRLCGKRRLPTLSAQSFRRCGVVDGNRAAPSLPTQPQLT
jgi:hypothetical protein